MNKKHLLFISPGFPKDESDTRCIPALQLFLAELAKRDVYHISLIALEYPYHSKNYDWKGISVYALGGNNKAGLAQILLLAKALRVANKINNKLQLNQVHSFWLGPSAWLGNKIATKFKIPHHCTLMGQDVLQSNKWLKKLKPLPTLIALTDYHNQQLQFNRHINAAQIIPWGIEKIMNNQANRSIDVLGVGNLTALKSYDRFIKIIAALKKNHPRINALIIGEGNQASLLQLIEELDLRANIQLRTFTNRGEVLEIMQKAKVFLHCAAFEAFGMVLIEALASACAVVSSPVGVANQTEEINTYEEDGEAVRLINKLLKDKLELNASRPYPVEATVNSYINTVF